MKVKRSKTPSTAIQTAMASGDVKLLEKVCRHFLKNNPKHLEANRKLGHALFKQKKTEEALAAFKAALTYWPQDAELLANYANVLLEVAQFADALPVLEKVCGLKPTHAIGWLKLAQCCYSIGQHTKGFDAALQAEKKAGSAHERYAALTQKAIHRRELGQIHEAVLDCNSAIALYPDDAVNHNNRMLFMLGDPLSNQQGIKEAAQTYSDIFEKHLIPEWPDFANRNRNPQRRLRLGFLSGDLRVHAVMCFAEGLFAQLDRTQFELYAFSLFPKNDQVTARVDRHVDHFVRLAGLTPREQATKIMSDEIDILIDMSGHTGGNGLMTMMLKPAPVQASWLGFVGTTGLKSIDYYITDERLHNQDSEIYYTEKLIKLPTSTGPYRPLSRNPLWRYQPLYAVTETPAKVNGYMTFGTCNNLGKITDQVLKLWLEILRSVPNSKLLIEGKGFHDKEFLNAYIKKCMDYGFAKEQLILVPLDTINQYLTYHKIDIALDPFPLTGGTTTCDTLWMGVPLVSLRGSTPQSRMSNSTLEYIGHSEWVVDNESDYIELAIHLANDITTLSDIRKKLREEFENSRMMDEKFFCSAWSIAMREMWHKWISNKNPDHFAPSENEISTLRSATRVSLNPGESVPLTVAYALLEDCLNHAKLEANDNIQGLNGFIIDDKWKEITELAEKILDSCPNDPFALSSLAEVEKLHGNFEYANVYMEHAVKALAKNFRH